MGRKTEAHYSVRVPYELAVEIFGSEERLRHGVSRSRASNWRRDGVPASVVLAPLMAKYNHGVSRSRPSKRRDGVLASVVLAPLMAKYKKSPSTENHLARRSRRYVKCKRCIRLLNELAEKGEWKKIAVIAELLELIAKDPS